MKKEQVPLFTTTKSKSLFKEHSGSLFQNQDIKSGSYLYKK